MSRTITRWLERAPRGAFVLYAVVVAFSVYVPYGSVLFDRLIASTGVAATAVFTIYVADALGYTGSVGVQLYRDLAQADATRLVFFRGFTYAMSVGAVLLLSSSLVYFMRHDRR